jgi:tRNA(adenine34) deaminase
MTDKEKFMKEALKEAKKAYNKEEIPVGAVIVKDNKIIARAYNVKEEKNDTTKHAEILAIQKASKKLNSWRLTDCDMYVTLEPCSMCAGALIQARIRKVYIGTMDEKTGACGSVLNLLEDYKFNHTVQIEKNIMKEQCENILKEFFKYLRNKKKEK